MFGKRKQPPDPRTEPWGSWIHVRSVNLGTLGTFWQRHPDRALPPSFYVGFFREIMERHGASRTLN